MITLLFSFFLFSSIITQNSPTNKQKGLRFLLDPPKLPNFGGVGYDAIRGNPKSNEVDPGFKKSIFKISYFNKQTTEDSKFLIPDGFISRMRNSCSYSSSSSIYTGVKGYQNDLKNFVKTGAQDENFLWKAGFSISSDFSKLKNTTDKEETVITEAGASCEIYSLEIAGHDLTQLDSNFITRVRKSFEENNWTLFFKYYGTHYVDTVIFGGRTHQFYNMSFKSYQELNSMGIDIQFAAKMKYASWLGDMDINFKDHSKTINAFEKRLSNVKEVFIGGKPPKSGNWKDWNEEVLKYPVPVKIIVGEISDLFIINHFYEFYNQDQLNKLKIQFKEASLKYCKDIGCYIPPDDKSLPPGAVAITNYSITFGGDGGDPFQDFIPTNPMMTIRKVIIRHGDRIDNIQFLTSDGVNSYYTGAHGKNGGEIEEFEVPEGEYISQVELRFGKEIDSLTFITNKGTKSKKFGGDGGNYSIVTLEGFLVSISGKSGERIDSIRFISNKVVYPSSSEI